MTDTILRQLAMLKLIPRAPRKITVAQLHDKLRDQQYDVNERTIQRDLNTLSVPFSLRCDDRSKPYGWQFMQDAEIIDLPGMGPTTALAFKLAEVFLEPLLPRSTLKELAPHMQRADQVLAQTKLTLKDWPNKVYVLPRGQELHPPKVEGEVIESVYQALLEERRFSCDYQPRNREERKQYEVNPLGLVFRNGVVYLVCTLWDYSDVRQLVLHRMHNAQLTDKPATSPEGFNLEYYIRNEQRFDYPAGDSIRLEALLEPDVATHLSESRLSEDQTLAPSEDGRYRLTASVIDTLQLRWWLLGFGDRVEVLCPPALRQEFARIAENLASRYAAAPVE